MEERPNSEQDPVLDEREQKAKEYFDRKMRLAKEPNSIVIAPRVRDVHLMAQVLYTTDRAINNMRLSAGIRVPLAKLSNISNRLNEFMKSANDYLKAIGGGGSYYSPGFSVHNTEQKQLLAQRKNTYVFVPKTAEGENLANLFISLDSAFCEFKVKSPLTDVTRIGEAIAHMKDIVRQFRDLTSEIAGLTRTPFVQPRGLMGFLEEGGSDSTNDNGRSRARAKHAKSNMKPLEGAEPNGNMMKSMEGKVSQ